LGSFCRPWPGRGRSSPSNSRPMGVPPTSTGR
jgi:hypothetical protein